MYYRWAYDACLGYAGSTARLANIDNFIQQSCVSQNFYRMPRKQHIDNEIVAVVCWAIPKTFIIIILCFVFASQRLFTILRRKRYSFVTTVNSFHNVQHVPFCYFASIFYFIADVIYVIKFIVIFTFHSMLHVRLSLCLSKCLLNYLLSSHLRFPRNCIQKNDNFRHFWPPGNRSCDSCLSVCSMFVSVKFCDMTALFTMWLTGDWKST